MRWGWKSYSRWTVFTVHHPSDNKCVGFPHQEPVVQLSGHQLDVLQFNLALNYQGLAHIPRIMGSVPQDWPTSHAFCKYCPSVQFGCRGSSSPLLSGLIICQNGSQNSEKYFFFNLFFNWRKIAVQCCVGLWYNSVNRPWLHTHPLLLNLPPLPYPTPLGHHRAPGWAPCVE